MAVHEVGRPVADGSPTDKAAWVVSAGKWKTVASLVKTRTEKQCRLKWSEVVKASISVGTDESASKAAASSSSSSILPTTAAESKLFATSVGANGSSNITVAEWGSVEDAQLLSTLNKVINPSQTENSSSDYKTSRLEPSDFVGTIVTGNGHETLLTLANGATLPTGATTATSSVIPSHHAATIPSIASATADQSHSTAAAGATTTTTGLVAPTLHLPLSAAQQQQLQHHIMPEGSYIWTHHPL